MNESASDTRLPWLYILSAGRTGTVFLTQLLGEYATHATVMHEPFPTRNQMMLANFRNDTGFFGGILSNWFSIARRRRAIGATGPYVEVNSFLCALTDLLLDPDRPLRIVHIVREPSDWARSMTVFKASRRFRRIIDYVPFAKPFPAPRPKGWRNWSQYERNLARWVWCNERILALEPSAEAFVTLRYEDLFGSDALAREATVCKIFHTLGLSPPDGIVWDLFETRANPAPPSDEEFDASVAERIAGPLARKLGYGR